jgi:hypothetical protein
MLYTLGETFHSLPSRQDKRFMTKQSTILALDYDRKKGFSGVHVRRGLDSATGLNRSMRTQPLCAISFETRQSGSRSGTRQAVGFPSRRLGD